MEYHQYEEAILKAQKTESGQRDWFLLSGIALSFWVNLYLTKFDILVNDGIYLKLAFAGQFSSLILLMLYKSFYIHYLGLLLAKKPVPHIRAWRNNNIVLQTVATVSYIFSLICSFRYILALYF